MEKENEDKRIVKIVTITMASMFLGVVLIILSFILLPKFLNGPGRKLFPEGKISMSKRVLREKYGEEFIVHNVHPNSPKKFFAECSPVSNEEVVFRAVVWKDGRGVVYDEYLQGILEREFKKEMEEELEKYHDNAFVKVYLPNGADNDTRYGDINIQDLTMEEYIKRADLLWCRIEIGIDAEEENDYLEEYAFYESMQERITDKKIPPLRVAYYNMDEELKEWCRNYFTQYADAYGTYISKRAKCNKMEFECKAEGVSITYDEFKLMREELGKDE